MKLDAEDFDLDAWKSSAIYVLMRIFGSTDPKITEINNLKIDYSSWALRDSNAKYKPIETCKRKGKEILEIAKDEIELFDIPQEPDPMNEKLKRMVSNEQFENFTSPDTSENERSEILKSLTKDELTELVLSLL